MKLSTLLEHIRLALRSILANRLRTILTIAIIALGITAMVGILTSIDGIRSAIDKNFVNMGANSFNITNRSIIARSGDQGNDAYDKITKEQAVQFVNRYRYPGTKSVSVNASFMEQVSVQGRETNPNVRIFGVDEHYLKVSGYSIAIGRNFTNAEILSGSPVAILGADVHEKLFRNVEEGEGKKVLINGVGYQIIGLLESRGLSMRSSDNLVLLSLNNVERFYDLEANSYMISVAVSQPTAMDPAIGEAKGLFRQLRRLHFEDDDNFDVVKSDSLLMLFIDQTQMLRLAAILIGLITLLGAAID